MELSPNKIKALEEKRRILHLKYAQAVTLYKQTELPLSVIADKCKVSVGGLGNYLRRYQRELVLKRHHIPIPEGKDLRNIKIMAIGVTILFSATTILSAVFQPIK